MAVVPQSYQAGSIRGITAKGRQKCLLRCIQYASQYDGSSTEEAKMLMHRLIVFYAGLCPSVVTKPPLAACAGLKSWSARRTTGEQLAVQPSG
jgi:hypothetical protein